MHANRALYNQQFLEQKSICCHFVFLQFIDLPYIIKLAFNVSMIKISHL